MPATETNRPVLASEWGDRRGMSAQTAQRTTGRRTIEPIATPMMIRAVFMELGLLKADLAGHGVQLQASPPRSGGL